MKNVEQNSNTKYLIIEYIYKDGYNSDYTKFYKIPLDKIDTIKYDDDELDIAYFEPDDSCEIISLSFEHTIIYSITGDKKSNGALIKNNIKLSSATIHIYKILSYL